MCSKVKYSSENAANLSLVRLWKKHHSRNRVFSERHAYRCQACKHWHLTSH